MAQKLVILLLVLAVTQLGFGPGSGVMAVAQSAGAPATMADCAMPDSERDNGGPQKCPIDGGCTLRCAPLPVFELVLPFVLFSPDARPQVFYFDLTARASAAVTPLFRPPRSSILA